MYRIKKTKWGRRLLHGSKLEAHLSGSCKAMLRSTPDIGGPLTRTHKQGCPKVLTALQQVSLGGIGLNGDTAVLHGISCTSAEKNVLPQVCPRPCSTITVMINIMTTKETKALPWQWDSFMIQLESNILTLTVGCIKIKDSIYMSKKKVALMQICISILPHISILMLILPTALLILSHKSCLSHWNSLQTHILWLHTSYTIHLSIQWT